MTNLKFQESEQINYDASKLGDRYRFYYNKGIEVEQIDYENDIAGKENMIAGKKKYIAMLNQSMNEQMEATASINPKTADSYYAAVDELANLEALLVSIIEACEACIEKRENGTEQFTLEGDGYSNWGAATIEFLHLYVNTLSLDQLCTIFLTAEMCHENKEISWYHYLVIGISTSRRLAMQTKRDAGWWDTCDRLRANKAKFQTSNREIAMDTEARVFGEYNFDIESKLDHVRWLRTVAESNNCSLFEAACLYED